MRPSNYLALLALLLLLSACGQGEKSEVASAPEAAPARTPAVEAAAAPAAATPANLALLNDYLAAWNEHDANKAGGFLAEDVQYFDAAFAGMQQGRQATVENGIKVFLRGVPDLRWEIRSEPIVGRDGVAYEWTFTGTNTGTWGGIPATRQSINLKGMGLVRIRNGKIVYQAVFYDSATLNRQLGL